jgi:hypothetical protein
LEIARKLAKFAEGIMQGINEDDCGNGVFISEIAKEIFYFNRVKAPYLLQAFDIKTHIFHNFLSSFFSLCRYFIFIYRTFVSGFWSNFTLLLV